MTVFPGPADLTLPALGGLHVLEDGRVLVGTTGAVWVFARGNWQKWILARYDGRLLAVCRRSRGALYAATDTDVYRITPEGYTRWQFPPRPTPCRRARCCWQPCQRTGLFTSTVTSWRSGTARPGRVTASSG